MKKTDLSELVGVVENVRQELHPTLDADFLASVVRIEEMNPEDDDAAQRAIQQALTNVLDKGA